MSLDARREISGIDLNRLAGSPYERIRESLREISLAAIVRLREILEDRLDREYWKWNGETWTKDEPIGERPRGYQQRALLLRFLLRLERERAGDLPPEDPRKALERRQRTEEDRKPRPVNRAG